MLTWQDLDVIEAIVAVLHPFSSLTDLLSGDEAVTVSCVLPLLTHIEEVCAPGDEDVALVKDMKAVILKYIKDRYEYDKW